MRLRIALITRVSVVQSIRSTRRSQSPQNLTSIPKKALCGRFGISALSLFGIRSSRSSDRSPHDGVLGLFWLSFRIHATAGVISLCFGRARREVSEHFVVSAPRTRGPVELCQRRVVSKEGLQTRRLRGK